MQGHPGWHSTVVITCSLAIILVAVAWTAKKTNAKRRKSETSEEMEPENVDENVNCEKVNCENVNCENKCENDNCENDADHEDEKEKEECTNDDVISELPDPKWVKVGQIQELYMYPLKSGRGKNLRECTFTEFGISLENEGKFTLKDSVTQLCYDMLNDTRPFPKGAIDVSLLFIRMFLVYNEETGRFQTGRHYPTLILVSLSTVDETKVKLEAVGMPSVIFEVPNCSKNASEAVQCTMWWGEPVKCIDCGTEPAEWLSRFLTGTTTGLRLGYTMMDRRNIFVPPWKKFTEVYQKLRNEDTGLFSDLASYMLMTTRSVEQLNEKLERPVPTLQFRPNILVSTQQPFEEDKWEWIKIGERVVIRNVKPCSRCKLVGVNPENGAMDKEEPLKTLKSFREQTDPDRISLEGRAPTMGIYCGLYVPGTVKIGDEVFIHSSNDSPVELNRREAAS